MISTLPVIAQAFLGTLMTWGFTALGSAMVFFFSSFKRSFLDGSLGFAAGVMTAASVWSLLLPALEICQNNIFGGKEFACIPVTIGFVLGALFVYLTDVFLPEDAFEEPQTSKKLTRKNSENDLMISTSSEDSFNNNTLLRNRNLNPSPNAPIYHHKYNDYKEMENGSFNADSSCNSKDNDEKALEGKKKFRKIILLIIAVTFHNIPEGLAVGVGFGAIGKSNSATFESARNLAIGIGIQNFPEGLAVSLPLYASGYSHLKAFWYGQLSGMVEPIASVIGALAVGYAEPFLPYALAFAAGAMIYVVFENIIPEASSNGNSKLSTWCCIIGFCVMMCLDVGFG